MVVIRNAESQASDTHGCGPDQDLLDLRDVHPPHDGLSDGGHGRHGTSLGFVLKSFGI